MTHHESKELEVIQLNSDTLNKVTISEPNESLDEESMAIVEAYWEQERLKKEEEERKKKQQNTITLKSNVYKEVEPPIDGNLLYLGTFFCTEYCKNCNGGYIGTSTGKPLTPGQTVATKLSLIRTILPYGSKIYISGYGYRIIEDCGGGGSYQYWLDICVAEHGSEGSSYQDVWLVVD